MFCNFYLVKKHKIVDSTTTVIREKISTNLGFLEFLMFFDAGFANFKKQLNFT